MKYPETAALARRVCEATGSKRPKDFVALTDGTVALRTFQYWLSGRRQPSLLEQAALRAMAEGWRPVRVGA